MSQRNKVKQDGKDYWFGTEKSNRTQGVQYGGVFRNWDGTYTTYLSMSGFLEPGRWTYRKFRHAKKALTKWINP